MKYFSFFFTIWPLLVNTQNLPACDSLVINCCTVETANGDSFRLDVKNPSLSTLFDYPSFMLSDSLMDTIAFETVYYFGIGSSFQTHYMDIKNLPITLPFSGYLQLYMLFYDSLACTFPITIEDTTLGLGELEREDDLEVYPNPSSGSFNIKLPGNGPWELRIFDGNGKQQYAASGQDGSEVTVNDLFADPGIYILTMQREGFTYRKRIVFSVH